MRSGGENRRWMWSRVWLPAFIAAVLLVLSLGAGGDSGEGPLYQVEIGPAKGERGVIALAFYGSRLDEYLESGQLVLPPTGWEVVRATDSAIVRAERAAAPIRITARDDEPVRIGLIRHAAGGVASIDNAAGERTEQNLRSPGPETVVSLVIGGPESNVRSTGRASRNNARDWVVASLVAFLGFAAVALRLGGPRVAASVTSPARAPRAWELVACAVPLLLTPCVTLIAFLPGNVAYDGALQWVQAAGRGELHAPLGYPTTYLMRLFALVSPSPLPLIVLQTVAAAIGVSLVLRELRFRGVPAWAILLFALVLAVLPQYPSFVTNLGKDALSLAGALFFAWGLLAAFRLSEEQVRLPGGLIATVVAAGLFSGLMRGNVLPAVLVVMLVALVLLYRRRRDVRLVIAGVAFLAVGGALPPALTAAARVENVAVGTSELPLGAFANLYMYHLFSAAVAEGVPLPAEDAALFLRIAPREAWANYDCHMTDVTMSSVAKAILMNQHEYHKYMLANHVEMGKAILRLGLHNPGLLLRRQVCVTRMLWHVGLRERPFQTTVTLGYDSVDPRFLTLVGASHSPFPKLGETLRNYLFWSERPKWFWLFWKPALPLLVGFFIVGMYLLRRRDPGVLVVALLPLVTIGLLLAAIPFPAYRYAYPSVLLTLLLSCLVFVRPPAAGTASLH